MMEIEDMRCKACDNILTNGELRAFDCDYCSQCKSLSTQVFSYSTDHEFEHSVVTSSRTSTSNPVKYDFDN